MTDYTDFLASKTQAGADSGFAPIWMPDFLFDFQAAKVEWAVRKGRAATLADGRVPYLRNGKHWLASAEPEDNPNWKGGRTPERQEFYRSPEWKAACHAVWTRDNACCRNCGLDWRTCERKTTPTFHVHHVWSFQIRATRANPALMVLLCRPCHLWVHSNANVTRAWLPQDTAEHMPSVHDLARMFDAGVFTWEAA